MPNERAAHPGAPTLRGMRVVLTRPSARGETLARAIEQRGGEALPFPVVEIAPPRDAAAARSKVGRLAEFEIAIFTSVNAVDPVIEIASERGQSIDHLDILAVGDATRRALRGRGWKATAPPRPPHTSEALLGLPRLAPPRVAGQRVILFKGEGGRGLLEAELERRGARVETADVYRRTCPRVDGAWLNEAGLAGAVDAVIVTSAEGARNLFGLLGESGRAWLSTARFVTVSERVAQELKRCGASRAPVVASGAGDDALIDALERCGS